MTDDKLFYSIRNPSFFYRLWANVYCENNIRVISILPVSVYFIQTYIRDRDPEFWFVTDRCQNNTDLAWNSDVFESVRGNNMTYIQQSWQERDQKGSPVLNLSYILQNATLVDSSGEGHPTAAALVLKPSIKLKACCCLQGLTQCNQCNLGN